jgi:hypothetical protein
MCKKSIGRPGLGSRLQDIMIPPHNHARSGVSLRLVFCALMAALTGIEKPTETLGSPDWPIAVPHGANASVKVSESWGSSRFKSWEGNHRQLTLPPVAI